MIISLSEQFKWVQELFPHQILFQETEKEASWSDDYLEVFLYPSEISDELMIRIQNVELVSELIFCSQIPETKEKFKELLKLAKVII